MAWKRILIGIGLVVAIIAGYVVSVDAAQLQLWQAYAAGSYTYTLFFETLLWVIPVAIALGLFFGIIHAQYRTTEPDESEGLIRRHDPFGAFFEHWTVTIGTLALILSGIWLGFLFVPRLAATTETVGLAMNVHWVGTVLLLFVGSYHIAGLIGGDHRDIVPTMDDVRPAIQDVKHYLGMAEAPEAEKYLPIQRVSYLIWGVLLSVMALTGLVKVADYLWAVGGGLKAAMTLVHDVFALLTILFLLGHIAVVLMPAHLQLLRSQVTGWIPKEYVREHHSRWIPGVAKRRGDGGRNE